MLGLRCSMERRSNPRKEAPVDWMASLNFSGRGSAEQPTMITSEARPSCMRSSKDVRS